MGHTMIERIALATLLAVAGLGAVPDAAEAADPTTPKECLAMALYHEARGEPVEGQVAVANVIMNRVDSRYHPDTVCGVVYKNAHRKNACQFSFACDGVPDRPKEGEAWGKKLALAEEILGCDEACRDAKRQKGGIESSTHYHATYVSPSWASKLERKGKVGNHVFYYTATL